MTSASPLQSVGSHRPSSGAIPRFPIWEVVVMVFIIVVGLVGVLGTNAPSISDVLGSPGAVKVWYAVLTACGVGGLFGLRIPAPNGLIVLLTAMVALALAAGSVLIGLVVATGDMFFAGSITLWVFMVGSVCRSAQLIGQLRRLRVQVEQFTAVRAHLDTGERR